MTFEQAQELMNEAWEEAVIRARQEYGIIAEEDIHYSNIVSSIQGEIYEELGGDLDEYYELWEEA